MSRARFEQVAAIFEQVSDLSPADRTAFLERACGEDAELRDEVESLLQRHDREQADARFDTLERDVREKARDLTATNMPAAGPRFIDRYEIRGVIAAGGMGTVYEAVQDHPHRRVALKLMRRGMTSRSALQRFRHEAEILGRLQHPNIGQIFDAGKVDDGEGAQPYFAMEFVQGRPLIEHCNAQDLRTRDRLALFVKVCDAVQYAHLRGVIHRDLKPDNILVDDHGEPKILDFGIARATDADIQATTHRTDVGQLVGTIPYMSPEQVTGDPHQLDARSDVYSLGVILYEMLCGRLPHDLKEKNIPEAVRIIREEDPTPLSSVNRVFRGDLETIAAKSLEKERSRRYQSPAELAADIRHYLSDEPIVARPASTFYQLRKFARRNRVLVGGAAAVFVVLAAGATLSTLFAIGEARARSSVELEARKATEINAYFRWVLSLVNPNEEGGTSPTPAQAHTQAATFSDLLDMAGAQIDSKLADWPVQRADLHERFGHTYFGRLDMFKAAVHFERAYQLRTEWLGPDDPATLVTKGLMARTLRGRHDETEVLLRDAAEGLAHVAGPEHPDTLKMRAWWGFHRGYWRWQFAEGEQILRETLAAQQRLLGNDDPATIDTARLLVQLLVRAQRYDDAEKLARHWLAVGRTELGEDHFRVIDLRSDLGEILLFTGRVSEAETVLREAHDTITARSAYPTVRASMVALRLGQALDAQKRGDEAERLLRDVAKATRAALGDNDIATWLSHYRLGYILNEQGKLNESLQIMREAYDNVRRIQGEETWLTLAMSYKIGSVLRVARRYEDARERLQWTLEQQRQLLGPDAMEAMFTLDELAQVARDQNDFDEAERLYRAGVEGRRETFGTDHPQTLQATSRFAWFLRSRGSVQAEEAEALLRETLERQRAAFGEANGSVLLTMHRLGAVVAQRGNPEAGATWLRRAWHGRSQLYGEGHPDALWSMFRLAQALQAAGELADAEDLARDAVEVACTAHGEEDRLTLVARDTLGVVLHLRGKNNEAVLEFEQVASGAPSVLSREYYGRSLQELGRYDEAAQYLDSPAAPQDTETAE